MILKASRISTAGGAGKTAAHVLRGEANEEITLLQGSEDELHDAMRDARRHGATYGLRHFKISPGEAMERQDARLIVRDLAGEFGFDEGSAVIVEHRKPRAGGLGFDHHWHALVPEVDPISGRVLDSSWMRPRHEKIARLAEARLGHDMVPGRWNEAVARALDAEGHHPLAQCVAAMAELPRPEAAYTTTRHQAAARRGHDLPADKQAITAAWRASDSPQAFAAALVERGITIRQGDKPGAWIAERSGDLIGAVHRLTGTRLAEVRDRLSSIPSPITPMAAHGAVVGTSAPETPWGVEGTHPRGDTVTPSSLARTPTPGDASTVSRPAPVGPQGVSGGDSAPGARPAFGPLGTTGTGGGGAAAADAGGDAPPVRSGDDPEAWRRWFLALDEYDRRKREREAAILRASSQERNQDAEQAIRAAGETVARAISDLLTPAGPDAPAVVGGRYERDPGGHGERSGRHAADAGPSGHDARHGRSAASGNDGRQPATPPRPPRAEAGRRAIEDRPGDRPPGARGREPGQNRGGDRRTHAAAGRARVEDARLAAGLTRAAHSRLDTLARLVAALDAPAVAAGDPAALVRHRERLEKAGTRLADDIRVAWFRVRPAPWPDPEARGIPAIKAELLAPHHQVVADALAFVPVAQQAAREATARVSWAHVLAPWTTEAERLASHAAEAARHAEEDAAHARDDLMDAIRRADRDAPRIAGRRSREQAGWEASPEIQQAREVEHLSRDALDLACAGDAEVASALVAGDLSGARTLARLREEDAERLLAPAPASEVGRQPGWRWH